MMFIVPRDRVAIWRISLKAGVMKANSLKVLTGALVVLTITACGPGEPDIRMQDRAEVGSGIIGGHEVAANNPIARHVVALYDTKKGSLCSGTLIGANLVLTAAHCLTTDVTNTAVVFSTSVFGVKREQVRRALSGVIPTQRTMANNTGKDHGDIAVLQFEGTLPPGYVPLPILPAKLSHVLRNGQLTLLAGYGITDGPGKKGSGTLRHTSIRISNVNFSSTEVKLDQTKGNGACHGDSGGPAFIVIGTQAYVWGVTSRGVEDPNDHCNGSAVYTSAAAYEGFIQQAIAHFAQKQALANRPAAGITGH